MAGEVVIVFGIIVLCVVLALLYKKPKREMAGAEKMAYESELGRLQAQEQFKRRW